MLGSSFGIHGLLVFVMRIGFGGLTSVWPSVHNRRMHRRMWLALLMVLPLAGCLETDLTLRADGSVAGTISWTPAEKMPEAGVRAVLAAQGVTVKRVELTDIPADKAVGTPPRLHRVTADVEATSVKALTATPLFKGLSVSAELGKVEGGKQKLTVQAAGKSVASVPDSDNVVRLHLPGAVAETSAKASGSDVTWTIPAKEFKTKKSVELSVVYAAESPPPEKKE
jgi:hypothetical protein